VPEDRPFTALFVGRDAPEKGLPVLREAWRRAALPDARLEVVGGATPEQVRNSYAGADVLVIPSIATRRFLEPWGLVANEAMNQHLPIIATDAVGAAAGGLVRDGRNGLVVAAGDPDALAEALRTLYADPTLRARLGANGAQDVAAYTHTAWADAFADALRSATAGAVPC
jgi:glycosyltransferase involved in cell wall biosynthesis